jgi:hypothetical protein
MKHWTKEKILMCFIRNILPVALPQQDIVVDPHQFFIPPILWWLWMILPIQEHYFCVNMMAAAALIGYFSIKFLAKSIENSFANRITQN